MNLSPPQALILSLVLGALALGTLGACQSTEIAPIAELQRVLDHGGDVQLASHLIAQDAHTLVFEQAAPTLTQIVFAIVLLPLCVGLGWAITMLLHQPSEWRTIPGLGLLLLLFGFAFLASASLGNRITFDFDDHKMHVDQRNLFGVLVTGRKTCDFDRLAPVQFGTGSENLGVNAYVGAAARLSNVVVATCMSQTPEGKDAHYDLVAVPRSLGDSDKQVRLLATNLSLRLGQGAASEP